MRHVKDASHLASSTAGFYLFLSRIVDQFCLAISPLSPTIQVNGYQ